MIKTRISLENIGFIIILITILLLNIFIGSNVKGPIWIIQFFISTFTLIYLIINKIKKKKNIIINSKIDIFVLLFMISTTLPYIFKTFVSLEGTVNFILKYWSVYGLYILSRNIIKDDKKVNIIVNGLIISSVIPIVLGIDILACNIFEPFLDFINAFKSQETRMVSTFGYANTFATYLAVMISFAISQLIITNKKNRKILYIIYIVIATICITLTQSKAVIAIIALIALIFVIIGIKNKKISKKIILIGTILIVAFFIYFFVAINTSNPVETTNSESIYVIRGIESDKQYEFKFNLTAESDKLYNTFYISIIEISKYLTSEVLEETSFAGFTGEKIIIVKTDSEVDHIEIKVTNKLNQKITINSLEINNSPYILQYKIIPDEIVRLFTTFNFKNSSVWQRGDYWKDGLKIIKSNWLIGAGGNAWRMLYGVVQDYLYYAKEAHSYFLELWMSFGVLGIISYVLIIAETIAEVIKLIKIKKDNKTRLIISIGFIIIILHAVMDFDMSYLIMEMLFFIIVAILNKNNEGIQTRVIDYVITGIFMLIVVGNTLGLVANIAEDETWIASSNMVPWVSKYQCNRILYLEKNNIEGKNKVKYIKKYIKNEPYQYQNIMYEIMCNEMEKSIATIELEDVQFLNETWENIEIERKYEIPLIQKRSEIMLSFAEALKNAKNENFDNEANKILNSILKEYDENKYIVLDYKRNGLSEFIMNYKYSYYTKTYSEAKELLGK